MVTHVGWLVGALCVHHHRLFAWHSTPHPRLDQIATTSSHHHRARQFRRLYCTRPVLRPPSATPPEPAPCLGHCMPDAHTCACGGVLPWPSALYPRALEGLPPQQPGNYSTAIQRQPPALRPASKATHTQRQNPRVPLRARRPAAREVAQCTLALWLRAKLRACSTRRPMRRPRGRPPAARAAALRRPAHRPG